MTAFVFTQLVETELVSAALGPNNSTKFSDKDLNKAVKLGTANNYVLATNGDEIDGFVKAIEPFTVNDGFSFGGVQLEGRVEAAVGANQVGALAVGSYVVADTQVALGTVGAAQVKAGGAPALTSVEVEAGTAAAGGATSITLDGTASAVDDYYNGMTVEILSGTGAGQTKVITDYVGSTKVATVSTWSVNPDNTSVYSVKTNIFTQTAPLRALWRCIRHVTGTGVTGDTVLLERI